MKKFQQPKPVGPLVAGVQVQRVALFVEDSGNPKAPAALRATASYVAVDDAGKPVAGLGALSFSAFTPKDVAAIAAAIAKSDVAGALAYAEGLIG